MRPYQKAMGIGLLALLVAGGAAYLYVREVGLSLRFTQQELQAALSQRMPMEREYKRIHIRLFNPRLVLQEGSERVQAGVDVNLALAANGLLQQSLQWQTSADASSAVRYDASTGQLFLTAPQLESLQAQGLPTKWLPLAQQAVTYAIQQWYATRPIYTLREDQLTTSAARMLLKEVKVEQGVLVVRLGL